MAAGGWCAGAAGYQRARKDIKGVSTSRNKTQPPNVLIAMIAKMLGGASVSTPKRSHHGRNAIKIGLWARYTA
jgi:hypothetical protein